jgi:hypothetical protein
MQFADPQELSTAYLILRHLYDGDVIEWPIAEEHPLHSVFAALESQGYVARWDRMWPRRDRYRLTEKGIATIEAVYRPAGAELVFDELRRKNLPPPERRAYLQSLGHDPTLWSLLHDPSTHWDSYRDNGGRYTDYIWEDQRPVKRKRRGAQVKRTDTGYTDDLLHDDDYHRRQQAATVPYLVDLDREAHQSTDVDVAAPQSDYDVS